MLTACSDGLPVVFKKAQWRPVMITDDGDDEESKNEKDKKINK